MQFVELACIQFQNKAFFLFSLLALEDIENVKVEHFLTVILSVILSVKYC